MIAAYMLTLFVFLAAGCLIILRLPPWLAALLWVAVPLALMPLWLDNAAAYEWTWFAWAKIWSVTLACAWISWCSGSSRISPVVAGATIWAALALNILEAAARDVTSGHWLNAVTAVLVIAASLVAGSRTIATKQDGRHVLLLYDLPWIWIAGYALWHSCFIYINWDATIFGQNIAVMAAAVILALTLDRKVFLQARALTLGLYVVAHLTFYGFFWRDFDTSSWQDPPVVLAFQVAALSLAVAACVAALRRGRRGSPWRLAGPGGDPAS